MIKLQCDDVPEDYIEAKECFLHPGNVFIKVWEGRAGNQPHGVSLTPEKARALGLELIKLAGGVHAP